MVIKIEDVDQTSAHNKTVQLFDAQLTGWARLACEEWGFACPPSEFFEKMTSRLPEGLRATIGFGLEHGLVIPQGYSFFVKGLRPGKGPYRWFSCFASEQRPNPNWEYYVQVAEFVRLSTALAGRGYELTFEDDLMDIGVYSAGQLVVCCEIKEKSIQATRLVSRMKSHQAGVDLSKPDRGNDPLRKAKYLLMKRPKYFYLVAIGARLEFSLSYPHDGAFELREDLLPFV
jgi:hypothetical protein